MCFETLKNIKTWKKEGVKESFKVEEKEAMRLLFKITIEGGYIYIEMLAHCKMSARFRKCLSVLGLRCRDI